MGKNISRRDFVKATAAMHAAVMTSGFGNVYAGGSAVIRVGLIGCGGRGKHDTSNLLTCADNIELVAMADLFEDRAAGTLRSLKEQLKK